MHISYSIPYCHPFLHLFSHIPHQNAPFSQIIVILRFHLQFGLCVALLIIYLQTLMKSEELRLTHNAHPSSIKPKPPPHSTHIHIGRSSLLSSGLLAQEQSIRSEEEQRYGAFLQGRRVEVERPELIKEGLLTSYKLYRIRTWQGEQPDSGPSATVVNRRFNDFQFLHHQILDGYGGCVLPRLPQKNFLANLNLQTQEFAQVRTRELQKYLQKLLSHGKVRRSEELRRFLFDQDFDFSFSKGEYSEQTAALDGLRTLTSSVYDITRSVYARFVGGKEKRCEFSRIPDEESELRAFEHEVDDLLRVTKEISAVIDRSVEEITLVHQLSALSHRPHLATMAAEQEAVLAFTDLKAQFQEIANFIENCRDAIERTKGLRLQVQELQQQQAAMEARERDNPRNRELDVIRSKIMRASAKCEKWVASLRKELSLYTSQGRTMMEDFVRRFTALKGQLYSMADP